MEHIEENIRHGETTKGCFFVPRSRGFTIIETIVAIAILTIAMVAPLSLAQRGLNASVYARDQITAFYLAQEAIEYARNVRDNNNLLGRSGSSDWLRGLENCIDKTCGIDTTAVGAQTVDCNMAPVDSKRCLLVFQFNPTTGIYGDFGLRADGGGVLPQGWRTTVFTRKLQITPVTIGADNYAEADLVATVSWNTGIISKSITVNDKIFNWYPIAP